MQILNWLRTHQKWVRIAVFGILGLRVAVWIFERLRNYEPAVIWLTVTTVLFFLAIYAVKAVIIIIPAPALYIAAGAAFPTIWAIIITYIGITIGLCIAYHNGKRLGERRVHDLLSKSKRVSGFVEAHKNDLPSFCFISRVLPLPKDLLSMFFGALGMKFLRYLVISLLGMSPVMIPTVLAGSSITDPLSPEFLVPFGISLTVSLIVFAIYSIKSKSDDAGAI